MRADPDAIRAALRQHAEFGGQGYMREMVVLARGNIAEQMLQVRRGIEMHDASILGAALHSILGSAGNLGAEGLAHDARAGLDALHAEQLERALEHARAMETAWPDVLAVLESAACESRSTVAIIEDNADNRLLLRAILQKQYRLLEYASGIEALTQLAHETPALVLLDISLPEMDGREVLRRLRADARLRQVPVVALTAHAMLGDREKYLQFGFDDYISKPITDIVAFKKRVAELVQD